MNPLNRMGLAPFSGPPPWAPPPFPALTPPTSSFWTAANVTSRLKELRDTLNLAKAMQKELEILTWMKEREGTTEAEGNEIDDMSMDTFSKFMKDNQIEFEFQESMSLNTANAIMSKLRFQLEPFRVVTDGNTPWEEKSAAKRLADKIEKCKRNKVWRKRKRRRIAENIVRECEQFDKIDKEADEWMAKEIAKDAAQRKVEKMKEIAKLKAKEEKKRLGSELELVLIVEKLQELRSMRIQKLKKQGHFLPEEDDKFLDRVRAAVEEEERQSVAAAYTDAAKDAIANAEESTKHIHIRAQDLKNPDLNDDGEKERPDQTNETANEGASKVFAQESEKNDTNGPASGSFCDSVANLPMEFYHYYHGSRTDMGTLIEVRRTWDAYIRPGGRNSSPFRRGPMAGRRELKFMLCLTLKSRSISWLTSSVPATYLAMDGMGGLMESIMQKKADQRGLVLATLVQDQLMGEVGHRSSIMEAKALGVTRFLMRPLCQEEERR